MRCCSIAILFVASCAPLTLEEVVARWHDQRDDTPLRHIAVSPVAGDPSTIVAVCDWEPAWWGYVAVFRLREGGIAWRASSDREPDEQSVLSARGFMHPEFSGPLIEALGCTHMGNGSLYLYVLEGMRLRLLMETRAVDCHSSDGLVFRDVALTIDYRDVNGDGRMDVSLSGTIEKIAEEDCVVASWPCAKVFLQGPLRKFVEDPSRRRGFGTSD